MENFFSDELTSSKEPPQQAIYQQPLTGQLSPENLEQMKQQARELAVAQYYAQQRGNLAPDPKPKTTYEINQPLQIQPKVVYVRRNLTIAELLLLLAVSCGLVYGIPATWNLATQTVPRIEIRMK